ncbi:MAG: hypothetical protein WCT28_00630 [Patescibacteria group bacterium]|jgi:hypothetical protein
MATATILFALLMGCTAQQEDTSANTAQVTPTETVDEEAVDETEASADCEFWVWNGEFDDEGMQVGVTTNTFLSYILMSPMTVTINPGDDVVIEFDLRSYDGCGPIKINHAYMVVWNKEIPSSEEDYAWMKNPSMLGGATMEILEPPENFGSNDPIMTGAEDRTIGYCWDDGSGAPCPITIPTVTVPAIEERRVKITWDSTGTPPGTSLLVRVENLVWTDPVSGERITTYDVLEDLRVEVEVVEVE